jgi:glucokinase
MTDLALAIDLGGTNIRAGLVDPSGAIVTQAETRTRAMEGPSIVLDQIAEIAAKVLAGTVVKGAGMCAPGPIDTLKGETFFIQTLAGFEGFPLRQAVSDRLSLPVQVENDGIAGALAEFCHGAGRAYQDFIYVTISTGIGGGIIASGRPLRGRRGMAGHLGHMVFHRDWPRHLGAKLPCFEDWGAGPALTARATALAAQTPTSALHGQSLDARAVYAAAAEGDQLARTLVHDEAELLGVGFASLIHILSPEAIILGGGMAQAWDQLAPTLQASLTAHVKPGFEGVALHQAQLGTNSSLIGAAALIFHPHLTSRG